MSIDSEAAQLNRALRAAERQIARVGAQHEPLLPRALLILALQRMMARDGCRSVEAALLQLMRAISERAPRGYGAGASPGV